MPAWTHRAVRVASRVLVPVLVGLAGAWLAFLAFGRVAYAIGPFEVEYFLRPGRSVTDISLPPLGQVRANSHLSPLHFTATLRGVDTDGATRALNAVGVRGLVLRVEEEATAALRAHFWRWLGVGAVGAAAAAFLVYRGRWRPAVIGALSAVVLLGAGGGVAVATFRPSAFLQPVFSGSLEMAPRLVGPIRQATDRIEDFRVELTRLVAGATRTYREVIGVAAPSAGTVAVLHISDVHSSPLGMDLAQRLADSFEVDLVLDTGDITSWGSPLEAGILSRISQFDVPYVFVRGNHDSSAIAAQIGRIDNATVLENRPEEVAGLVIYGAPHPLFTPDPELEITDEEIEAVVGEAGRGVAARLEALPEPPDILALHDGRMAQASAGLVPLAVSGHFHAFADARNAGTLFLRVGTVSGGGADTFIGDHPVPLTAQVLYFSGRPRRLIAYDRIEVEAGSRDLSVDRRLVDEEVAEPLPGPSPTPGA